MKFRRPRSLNGLILVGFGLVGLPLLIAVIWALVNLDRLAEQSEQLVFTGVSAAKAVPVKRSAASACETIVVSFFASLISRAFTRSAPAGSVPRATTSVRSGA